MRAFLGYLLTAWFYLISIILFFILTPIAVLVWVFTMIYDRQRVAVHYYLSIWSRIYVFLIPSWRLRIEGRHLIPKGPVVFIANHQSMIDILVLYCLFKRFKWVAKKELFKIPFVGWSLSLGNYVSIQRSSRADAYRMIIQCRRNLNRGSGIMIFPEGTRSRTGRMGRFKPGAFLIAKQAGVPIVPIVLSGPSFAFRNHKVVPRMVAMRLQILEPVSVKQLEESGIGTLMIDTEARMREVYDQLNGG